MCVYQRHLAAVLALLALICSGAPASAWVETSIRSHLATIELDREGRAVITHEILMHVRGGPLEGFDLATADVDAEPLSDATVAPAKSGSGGAQPIPLRIDKRPDGSLGVAIEHEKGLRHGAYLFKLSYRTDLLGRKLLRQSGATVELDWMGPKLNDGIDSAKAVFRLPKGRTPPRLSQLDLEQANLGLDEEAAGVFLSNLRRAADKDELEIVRLHVSKGEAVRWRVQLSPDAVKGFAFEAAAPVTAEPAGSRHPRSLWIALSALVGLAYAFLVLYKSRVHVRACQMRAAIVRPLLPGGIWVRTLLAGSVLGSALWVAVILGWTVFSAVLLMLAMAAAAHLSPRARVRPRGPGEWKRIDDARAFAKHRAALPGAWLDTGTLRGFALFALALAGLGARAIQLLSRSPYEALLVVMAGAALLPVFCTGRASELPMDPAVGPRKLLQWLAGKLRRDNAYELACIGRFPAGRVEPDELRLAVVPLRARAGLIALEIGLEYQQGGGGPLALPCVLVRVQDRSVAYRALERSVVWQRGRTADERVAVVRPMLPTRTQCLSLVRRLAQLLSVPIEADKRRAQSASKAKSAAGSSSVTSKPARVPSPVHAR